MESNTERKKARERGFLHAFLQLSNLPAKVLEEREAPDFLLEVEGRAIGLEVTEVFIESNGGPVAPKVAESIVGEIVTRARRRYEVQGGKPLHVSIGFHSRVDMRHVSKREAADEIACFLLALDPPLNKLMKCQRRAVDRDALPEQIAFMQVLAVPDQTMADWWAPQAGWVAPLIAEFLQPSVDEKSRKIEQYRQVIEEVWLLLAIEGKGPSQLFEPSGEIPVVASPFDRTYLLSIFPRSLQLLPRAFDA